MPPTKEPNEAKQSFGSYSETHKMFWKRLNGLDKEVVALKAEVKAGSQKALIAAVNRVAKAIENQGEFDHDQKIFQGLQALVKTLKEVGTKPGK